MDRRLLLSIPTGLLIPWACLLAPQEYSMLLPVKGFYRLWFVLLLTLTFQGSCYWYHPLHKPGEWKGLIQGNEQLEAAPGSAPPPAPAQPSAGSWGCFHPEKVDSGMMYRAELSELVTHQPALP